LRFGQQVLANAAQSFGAVVFAHLGQSPNDGLNLANGIGIAPQHPRQRVTKRGPQESYFPVVWVLACQSVQYRLCPLDGLKLLERPQLVLCIHALKHCPIGQYRGTGTQLREILLCQPEGFGATGGFVKQLPPVLKLDFGGRIPEAGGGGARV
jgi:hypothetical protein